MASVVRRGAMKKRSSFVTRLVVAVFAATIATEHALGLAARFGRTTAPTTTGVDSFERGAHAASRMSDMGDTPGHAGYIQRVSLLLDFVIKIEGRQGRDSIYTRLTPDTPVTPCIPVTSLTPDTPCTLITPCTPGSAAR